MYQYLTFDNFQYGFPRMAKPMELGCTYLFKVLDFVIKYKNDKNNYLGWIVESISKTYIKKSKKKSTDEEKERKNKALY